MRVSSGAILGFLLLHLLATPSRGAHPDAGKGAVAPPPARPASSRPFQLILPKKTQWIETTPLDSLADPQLSLLPEGARTFTPQGSKGTTSMVCLGGEEVPPHCSRLLVEPGGALEVSAVAGLPVTGRCLVGRSPAARAEVSISPGELRARRAFLMPLFLDRRKQRLVRTVETDAAGRFRLPKLPAGNYLLHIRTPGGRHLPAEPFHVPDPDKLRPERRPEIVDLGDFAAPEGLALEVDVADAQGRPVAGAEVGLVAGDSPDGAAFFGATSDGAGRVRLSGLGAEGPFQLSCRADGFAEVRRRFRDLPARPVECRLAALARLSGAVVDQDGEPIEGALVGLEEGAEVTTGRDGTFELSRLQAGNWRLYASAPGTTMAQKTLHLAPGEHRKLAPLVLAPGDLLRGLVRDTKTRQPIAAARIALRWPPGGGEAASDEEGLFSLTAGAEEPLRVEVTAEGYAAEEVEIPPSAMGAEEPFPLDLSRGGRIRVQAWDESGDGPCQACEIRLQEQARRFKSHRLVTDTSGEATSDLLAPGPYRVGLVAVRSEGSTVRVSSGGDTREISVASDAEAAVVLGERRAPLEIVLEPAAPSGLLIYAEGAKGFQILQARPDGTFVLRRAPGDAYSLSLTDGAGTRVRLGSVPEDYGPPVLSLGLGAHRISGRLVVEGEPAGGEPVTLSRAGDAAPAAWTRTRADGTFALPFLSPGAYVLSHQGRALRSVVVGQDHGGDLGPVEVVAGVDAQDRVPRPISSPRSASP